MRIETTIKVYKRDALALNQIKDFLELREKSLTQSEFLHEVLEFLLDYEDEFFSEMEKRRKTNEKILEEWMEVLLRRTREL